MSQFVVLLMVTFSFLSVARSLSLRFHDPLDQAAESRFSKVQEYLAEGAGSSGIYSALKELHTIIQASKGTTPLAKSGTRLGTRWEALRRIRDIGDTSSLESFEVASGTEQIPSLGELFRRALKFPHLKSGWRAALGIGAHELKEGRVEHASWAYSFALSTSPFRKDLTSDEFAKASSAFLHALPPDPIEPAPLGAQWKLVWRSPDPERNKLFEHRGFGEYATRDSIEWMRAAHAEDKDAPFYLLPSLEALIVGGSVLYRSPFGYHGADLKGTRLWEQGTKSGIEVAVAAADPMQRPGKSQFDLFFSPRFHENKVTGAFSAEGSRGFTIVGVDPPDQVSYRESVQTNPWLLENRLIAVDKLSGHRLWEWGRGVCGLESLCQTSWEHLFFLGPPLVIEGELFALAEKKGALYLMSLSAETGRLGWWRNLGEFDKPLAVETQRRTQGVQLATGQGLLAIATNAGSLILFDIFLRQIRWVAPYQSPADQSRQLSTFVAERPSEKEAASQPVWHMASSPVLIEDRILIVPPDSRELRAYRTLDGSPLWKREGRHDHFFAGVKEGMAILVGSYGCRALDVSQGALVWQTRLVGAEGRGFFWGRHYYLPVRSGRLFSLDLSTGATRLVAKFDHPLGNLRFSGKYLVSQTEESLEVFEHMGTTER